MLTSTTVRSLSAAVGACALLLLSGCHSGGDKVPVAFVTNNSSDYWNICRSGANAAAKELGTVDMQFVEPSDNSATTQISDVNDLLTKGVKGIAISPSDPANETNFLNTVASKTSLLTSDSDAPASNRLCYIGTDNHAAGVMAGGVIKQALPAGGKIMLFVGSKDAQNAHDRISGIQDALKGTNITIADIRTDNADHAAARTNAADAIVSHPDVVGMVGIWSYNGPAIYNAVKSAGKQGKIKIVAFDQEADTMTGIKDGAIFGAIVQQPYQFGYQCIKLLSQLAKGDKSGIPPSKQIIIPTQVINQANITQYEAAQAKLMGGS